MDLTCPKCNKPFKGRPPFCPACGASLTHNIQPVNADPLIGRIINKVYRIDTLVGEGAMGRVYQAEDIGLRKKVALKVLRANLVNDEIVVRRFEREGQAASRLNHPNSISIYGCGQEDDGLLWIAMEFIQGRDLGTIIAEESPIPPARIIHIFKQICEALDDAHSAQVIHRDLKPANVVCFDYRHTKDYVKVLDFGIAKIIDPSADYQPLTREGIVCGTPAYMSPEQIQGFELDNRTDLFSLGIILYQTMTGKLPFYAESPVEVATKIVIEKPKWPHELRPEWSYPPELEAIAMKLLEKKRENRFETAFKVKEALDVVSRILESRSDAALALPPDEIARLLHSCDLELPLDGAATVRVSQKVVEKAIAQAQAQQPVTKKPESQPVSKPEQNKNTKLLGIGIVVGIVIAILVAFLLK